MKSHLKRLDAPKTWKVARRTHTWVARPRPSGLGLKYSMPLLVVFRDIIGLVHTKREMKYALYHNEIFVNGKRVKDYKFPVSVFNVISIPKHELYYRLIFHHTHLDYISIPKEEANLTIGKVVKKTLLAKSKDNKNIQLNLLDGTNILTDQNIKTGSSVVYDFNKKEIVNVLPFEKSYQVYIMRGRNEGKLGKIKEITDEYVFVDVNGTEARLKREFLLVVGKDKPIINIVKVEN